MKQRDSLVLLCISLICIAFSYENKFSYVNTSGIEKISLSNDVELIEINGGYTRLAKMGEGHTVEVGMPELPLFSTYYQLDPTKTYGFQLEILDSYIIENINVVPHQGMETWDIESINIINEEVYNSYDPYPVQNMTVSDHIQGRGIAFVNINVIPYKYYPKYQRLEIYTSIDIQVTETGENANYELNQPIRSHIFDEFYKDIIINFEYSDRLDDYQASAILYIGGGSSLDNTYVQELIDWRHKQGYIVYTATESEVGGSSASTSEIKNYISNMYFNYDNPPEIVGLIGDTGGSYSLPNYNHSWGGYSGATDFDYTQLSGNDMIPEVFIGRISASSSSDLSNIINKTLKYEKADYLEDRIFQNAGLAGDPDESGNSTIFTNQYIQNIMINHGMTGVQTDYDGSGVQTFMETQFNRGILYYNYRGWYGGYGSYPTSAIDNGYDTPFVTTITCGTGDFDGTSDSEQFVQLGSTSNPKGAVAAVGMATIGTHTAYNNIVNMGIYDGIFAKKMWYAGAAATYGDLAIVATYPNPNSAANAAEAFSKWSNLIGDPALHLWSAVPTDFSFPHPHTILLGTTMLEFTITDENNNIVENARVTLLMGDDIIFTTGLTDANGNISLSWSAVESGTMSLTVIKNNYRPYESTIDISSVTGTAVALDSDVINANAGEWTNFELSLQNYGSQTAFNVIAELSSLSEYVTIDETIVEYGNILSSTSTVRTFPVYIHGTAFDGEDMQFKLTISDENNNWINYVPVNVSAPRLYIQEYIGEVFPGAIADISLDIINQGSKTANDLLIEFLPYKNLVSVTSGSIFLDNLSVEENIVLDGFTLNFDEDIINGSIIPLEVVMTSVDGYTRSQIITVTAGVASETDPLGPDPYGYYIYDSGDIEYEHAPIYDWVEIAEGLGDQVSISDAGNGNSNYTSSTDDKNLPFTFTFYGVEYNTIQINTNGWISFGDFEMNAFRNYPIPGAGGPSPMVAAFWDDLMTGSSGYVYYYATDDYVVIQWDNMRTCGDLTGGWYASDCSGGPRETFEIILYSTNEIKIQYQDFNNTSDGNYPNGGTPSHGCYSTVGIENHFGDAGLQYTFNNTYPEAAATLYDGAALFITNHSNSEEAGCMNSEACNYNANATTDDGSCTYAEENYDCDGNCTNLLGDVNLDGILNILDVVQEVNYVLGTISLTDCSLEAADLDSDGLVNILDVVIMVNIILSYE